MGVIDELDGLLAKLGGEATAASESSERESSDSPTGDAIDQTLSASQRVTATRRLREDPVMVRFREEMSQGVVHADTVRGVLGLLSQVLDSVLIARS